MPILHVDHLKRDGSRPLVMAVLNVTPDSFASEALVGDGGVLFECAVADAQTMWAQGADLIDVGGESTRPNAERVTEAEELSRVIPVVRELTSRGIATSIDTMRASVARAAVEAGTTLVNDVSGGLADPEMLPTVAELGVPYIAMHWRRHSTDMYSAATYDNVASDVAAELSQRVQAALDAGIKRELLILDPGIGFSKLPEHNWALLRELDVVQSLGFPLLIGVSRKRFLGELLANDDGPRDPQERDAATAAVSAIFALKGYWGFRVHAPAPTVDAIRVATALRGQT